MPEVPPSSTSTSSGRSCDGIERFHDAHADAFIRQEDVAEAEDEDAHDRVLTSP